MRLNPSANSQGYDMQAALAPFWLAMPRSTVRGMIADAKGREEEQIN